MKQTRPNSVNIARSDEAGLEQLAREDGVQRGIFFDTAGKARMERVSATAQHGWLFKTEAGQPFKWEGLP